MSECEPKDSDLDWENLLDYVDFAPVPRGSEDPIRAVWGREELQTTQEITAERKALGIPPPWNLEND